MKLIQTFYYDRKKFIRVGNYYKRDLSIQEIMGRMSVGYTMRKYNYTELQTVKILLRYSYDRNAFI